MRFITYYRRLNQKLVRNPYPLPRIVKTMQQLEGFQYGTALYLNMEYHTIRRFPASQDMTTIVTEFDKFRYNRLPMVMCASGDIFQAKVDKLLVDIKGIKMYIDDILILRNYFFTNHIKQLRIVFSIFCAAGLKVNSPRCSFWLKVIPYLSYLIIN